MVYSIGSFVLFGFAAGALGATSDSDCWRKAPEYPPSVSTVKNFEQTKFDYLIVGGGTAGMTIGARLSENPKLVIGIIEAEFPDKAAGNPLYDWNFVLEPRTHAAGRIISAPRGKLLGGSSALNLMVWNRGSSDEYNAWEQMAPGNGWNWDGLLPFFKKSEDISTVPTDPYPGITPRRSTQCFQALCGAYTAFQIIQQASHNDFYPEPVTAFVESVNAMNFSTNSQPLSGDTSGVWNTLCSVDGGQGVRSYATRAYFCDQPTRPNLNIFLGASATKVLFTKTKVGLTATQVEFVVNSTTYKVNAKRDIVLSAGTFKTPQILELSGIGNATLLQSLNIQPLINLPGVGENLQEHPYVPAQYQLKSGHLIFGMFLILDPSLSFSLLFV
ncbi:hypothetical protein GYMLUDRAFT_249399 [Collybiopsis luxurians FD-317 M1]|uniref:Glucose-methanol-choline oxidoreductase N-terminal domain-containing protein n=1 Tax=Collybiopsis luxurians FD-317 M1 TaxID=944289 RepID=A0A0D0BXX7_9AGAR|nr:hypothetical protein GYMLUDRAFT_249399 [Collybiopsis luxurians FD-317 M1]